MLAAPRPHSAQIVAIEPRAAGGALVLGSIQSSTGDERHSFVRVLLGADWKLDPSLDGDGMAIDDGADASAFAGGRQGDGSAIIAGHRPDFAGAVLRRYLADGTVDETYGGSFPIASAFMYAGDVLPDASVLAADDDDVWRFTAAGRPDGAYGGDGTADLTFLGTDHWDVSVAGQPDGKAVVISNADDGVVVARLTAGGTPDTTFGNGGKSILALPEGMTEAFAGGVALQGDGKIVAAGFGGSCSERRELRALAITPGEQQAFVTRLSGDPAPPAETTTGDATAPAPTPPAPTTAATAKPIAAQSTNPLPLAKSCVSRRSFKIRLRIPHGAKAVKATVKVNGKQVKVIEGSRLRAAINLRGLPKTKAKVTIAVKLAGGATLTGTRTYRTCTPKRAGGVPKL